LVRAWPAVRTGPLFRAAEGGWRGPGQVARALGPFLQEVEQAAAAGADGGNNRLSLRARLRRRRTARPLREARARASLGQERPGPSGRASATVSTLGFALVGYLAGSIPTGYWLRRPPPRGGIRPLRRGDLRARDRWRAHRA